MVRGILALLTQSLRVGARSMRSHLFRLILVGVIYLFLLQSNLTSLAFGAPGLRFFRTIMYLNAVFITLAGLSFFASAVTEEKEEGTLGLLKMAGLSPLGLLLGKSTSRLIAGILLLLVQIPFTLLAITLGGVTLTQITAAYLALLAYLIMVANVALLCSVVCKRTGNAAGLAGVLVLGFLLVPPWLQLLLGSGIRGRQPGPIEQQVLAVCHWLEGASVFHRIGVILQSTFTGSAVTFQVISNLAVAAFFFALSWMSFEWFTRDQHMVAPARLLARQTGRRLPGLAPGRSWLAARSLIWKDFSFIAGGWAWMIGKFVGYALLTVGLSYVIYRINPSVYWYRYLSGTVMATMLIALILEASFYASRIFHEELKAQTLPALMMLPLSPAQIGYAKMAGCLLGLIPAAVYFLAAALYDPDELGEALSEPWVWISILTVLVFLHLTALLSLYVKWGAVLLALAIMFAAEILFSLMTTLLFWGGGIGSGVNDDMALGVVLVFLVLVIAGLQLATSLRLQKLGSQ